MSSFKDRPVISDFQQPGKAPSGDPLLGTIDSELADEGFLRHQHGRTRHLGSRWHPDVDDIRTCLLRHRDDADVDAAL